MNQTVPFILVGGVLLVFGALYSLFLKKTGLLLRKEDVTTKQDHQDDTIHCWDYFPSAEIRTFVHVCVFALLIGVVVAILSDVPTHYYLLSAFIVPFIMVLWVHNGIRLSPARYRVTNREIRRGVHDKKTMQTTGHPAENHNDAPLFSADCVDSFSKKNDHFIVQLKHKAVSGELRDLKDDEDETKITRVICIICFEPQDRQTIQLMENWLNEHAARNRWEQRRGADSHS